jgi:hypothetical protein
LIPQWINLLADWWLGAHTLESGTIECVGLEEPISLGINVEIDRPHSVNELYHVQGYTHRYAVNPDGHKIFRTTLTLTRGQRVDEYPIYVGTQINEEKDIDIGFSDTEFTGSARPGDSDSENVSAIDETELPSSKDRK